LNSLAKEYGFSSKGSSGTTTYTTKGIGTVTKYDENQSSGYMTVSLDGYQGSVEVRIQTGPVFQGSTVRDSLSFIDFNDFVNQVDFAKVSESILDIIKQTVIEPLDLNSITGKKVEFLGCFIVDSQNAILITPVSLKVD
jgi:predicted lipoprotein